jgi:DNA topoisomerase-2
MSAAASAPLVTAAATGAAQYRQHTPREHILELPDTYIGSVLTATAPRWVWNAATAHMEWRPVAFCNGFLKIFDEVLVNALDHRVRIAGRIASGKAADAHPVKHIDVTLTPTKITLRNDGDGVPVEPHAETGLWAPELIFGNLLTSSNYDKEEEKIVGGKNGFGAKLTNIYSREFTVETVDHRQKKKYVQTWTDNMAKVGKPKITAASVKPYTEIVYTPDLTRFVWGEEGAAAPTEIPADMLAVLATRVLDAAACAGKECRVTLNGVAVASNTFPKYMELYLPAVSATIEGGAASTATSGSKRIAFENAGERWEVGAVLTRDLYGEEVPDQRHITFVNGIAIRRGGKHVEYVEKHVFAEFCALAKRKAKMDLTPGLLKDSLTWFINCTVVNPAFDAQTKERLDTLPSKFGSLPTITPKFADALVKIGLLDEAEGLLDAKVAKDAKKTDGKKRATLRGIPKLDDATWAGTAKSAECTLILTEGDSAKTTAISGLKVVGRERYGVFPLKGKVMNADTTDDKINKNEEITNIKRILGLVSGKKYKDLKELRYGRVMIMTDQDVDGSHIKGLLMNLFYKEWPELLGLGFLCCLMTPLLKATKGSTTLCFYSEAEYAAWLEAHGAERGWSIKYYKGLGTSTAAEARTYFEKMNKLDYVWNAESAEAIDLAFNKKRANDRKAWLETFDTKRHLDVRPPADGGATKVECVRFVNDELIHFSVEDNQRSLPHVMDGLKPSLRKILWSAFKRNLTSEIRVAQLAGYVSEKAAYHHGEASLTEAIVGMAQDFVGSNNLNVLAPIGQFGTRLMGGKDAASPRYIHTELMPIARVIFKKADDDILEYTVDDTTPVEPVNYLPVVPMLLINGSAGIGTGFSTEVPPYNPADLIAALRGRLAGTTADLTDTELKPWWFGFKGTVNNATKAKTDKSSWVTRGVYSFVDDDKALVRITELPVGMWTQKYKEFLEKMLVEQDAAVAEAKKAKGAAAAETAALEAAATGAKKPSAKKATDTSSILSALKDRMKLRGYIANYNDVDVDFTLELDPEYYFEAKLAPAEFEKAFSLTTSFSTNNLTAFNTAGKIHKYKGVGEILEEFYGVRLAGYAARRAKELERLAAELLELEARHTFIKAVVEKRLIVANAKDEDLLAGLRSLALPPLSDASADAGLKGYEYLLRMRIDRIKAAALAELEAEIAAVRAAKAALEATTPQALWLTDLAEFETAWTSYTVSRAATAVASAVEAAAAAGKKGGAAKKPRAAAPKKATAAAKLVPAGGAGATDD